MSISRRQFVFGSALTAAGASALGLAACSSPQAQNPGDGTSEPIDNKNPVATYTCDLLVIGAGNSGLTACVQAADRGLGVLVLEKKCSVGGGGVGTEGVFAVNSSLQRQAGIEVRPVDVVKSEMSYSHNRANGSKWLDLIHASGDNLDWLIEKNVHFTGQVDTYAPDGQIATFHWFGKNRAHDDFTPYMYQNALDAGVQFLFNCPATDLITDESGAVVGAYAQKVNGDYIRIDAQAVIMGTGGCSNNNNYLEEAHFTNTAKITRFYYGYDGDGITLASSVGGAKTLDKLCGLIQLTVEGVGGADLSAFGGGHDSIVRAARDATSLWVNQDAERFVAENTGDENNMAQFLPSLTQRNIYSIFDATMYRKDFEGINEPIQKTIEDAEAALSARVQDNPYNDTYSGNTLEELAENVASGIEGISKEALLETIEAYNAMCDAKEDTDFGKPENYLVKIENPPFYFVQMTQAINVTFGGVQTDSSFRVTDSKGSVIPNLYSIGVDSAGDFWPNIYTRNVPGGINAHNINSGRTAATCAADAIGQNATGRVDSEGDTSESKEEITYDMPEGALKDGTYTATASGMFGDIAVTLTIEGGSITDASQENEYESSYVGVPALEDTLIPELLKAQNPNIDAVAGATMTSRGFCQAASAALMSAAE